MSITDDFELIEKTLHDILPWIHPLTENGKEDRKKVQEALDALHRVWKKDEKAKKACGGNCRLLITERCNAVWDFI